MESSLARRFWRMVNKDGPIPKDCPERGNCWLWTGFVNKGGYGMMWGDDSKELAHRVAWRLETGALPKEQVQHWCNARNCVRFSHFYLGDHDANAQYKVLCGRLNPVFGERHYEHHFTDDQIRQIRAEWTPCHYGRPKKGTCLNNVRALARKWGVTENAMRSILHRKTYRRVT